MPVYYPPEGKDSVQANGLKITSAGLALDAPRPDLEDLVTAGFLSHNKSAKSNLDPDNLRGSPDGLSGPAAAGVSDFTHEGLSGLETLANQIQPEPLAPGAYETLAEHTDKTDYGRKNVETAPSAYAIVDDPSARPAGPRGDLGSEIPMTPPVSAAPPAKPLLTTEVAPGEMSRDVAKVGHLHEVVLTGSEQAAPGDAPLQTTDPVDRNAPPLRVARGEVGSDIPDTPPVNAAPAESPLETTDSEASRSRIYTQADMMSWHWTKLKHAAAEVGIEYQDKDQAIAALLAKQEMQRIGGETTAKNSGLTDAPESVKTAQDNYKYDESTGKGKSADYAPHTLLEEQRDPSKSAGDYTINQEDGKEPVDPVNQALKAEKEATGSQYRTGQNADPSVSGAGAAGVSGAQAEALNKDLAEWKTGDSLENIAYDDMTDEQKKQHDADEKEREEREKAGGNSQVVPNAVMGNEQTTWATGIVGPGGAEEPSKRNTNFESMTQKQREAEAAIDKAIANNDEKAYGEAVKLRADAKAEADAEAVKAVAAAAALTAQQEANKAKAAADRVKSIADLVAGGKTEAEATKEVDDKLKAEAEKTEAQRKKDIAALVAKGKTEAEATIEVDTKIAAAAAKK